jgi:hypothetical protein
MILKAVMTTLDADGTPHIAPFRPSVTLGLHLLPWEKGEREMAYLAIAVEKTAGTWEREAWDWLCDRVAAFRTEMLATGSHAVGAGAPDMANPQVL